MINILYVLFSLFFLQGINASRLSSFPYLSGDSFRAVADHIFDETDRSLNPKNVREKDIIFLKTDYMEQFFSTIHPHIKNKYILITHNSDYGAPGAYHQFLNDDKLIKWLGMNPTISYHEKFIPIPIGIANREWSHGKIETFTNFFAQQKIQGRRSILLGMNFEPSSNAKARQHVWQKFHAVPFCTKIYSTSHATYLSQMANTKFILSPEGNGLDTHRTWEALLVGAIPIVTTSNLDPLFKGLPVVIINSWEEISESFLQQKYQDFLKTNFNYEKLFFYYWVKLLESYKK